MTDPGLGEGCDDGNRRSGDGCSDQCQLEVCGNGIVDVLQVGGGLVPAEECEDGNRLELDGCSSSCFEGSSAWETRQSATPRFGGAMAYDPSRGKTVLFGGRDGKNLGDTWEWDGSSWTELSPNGPSPSARFGQSMVYDPSLQRLVLFSGLAGALTNDTWEWDGGHWTRTSGAAHPTLGVGLAASYDATRKTTITFGGIPDTDPTDVMWEWDGLSWSRVSPTGPWPPARTWASMTHDPVRGRTVLFGGEDKDDNSLGDTWEWDGSRWVDRAPATSPLPRSRYVMAYDMARRRVVLHSGLSGASIQTDTWEWDGSNWSEVSSANLPPPRLHATMVYDTQREALLLFGGSTDNAIANPRSDTWERRDTEWVEVTPSTEPIPPRQGHAMARDAGRGRLVVFGGSDDWDEDIAGLYDDTWEWDGVRWAQVASGAPSPTARRSAAMAPQRESGVLLVGGRDGAGNYLGDTWTWDGSSWSNHNPTSSPSNRFKHALAYDANRDRTVLFGGYDGAYRDDTWEWDGSSWSRSNTASAPSPRRDHAMAYDAIRKRVVLFGGADDTGILGDTWEWDGSNWSQPTTQSAPLGRAQHAMTFDAVRGVVLLFGGGTNATVLSDLWEWDGQSWTLIDNETSSFPELRRHHTMAYDAVRGRSIVYGGLFIFQGSVTVNSETWRFSHRNPGPEACPHGFDPDRDGLSGCADPDCWARCTPSCPPNSTPDWPNDCDTGLPHCGDGICNSDLENCRLCPSDCSCPSVCGDFHCDSDESPTNCPGDCAP